VSFGLDNVVTVVVVVALALELGVVAADVAWPVVADVGALCACVKSTGMFE
jgi:hypothetical protein